MMNKQEKTRILEALMNGDIASVARPISPAYTNKFKDKARLLKQLRIVFGQDALIFCQGGQYWAISKFEGVWFFGANGDGTYSIDPFRSDSIILTEQEYKQICAEIDGKGVVWEEGKVYEQTTEP